MWDDLNHAIQVLLNANNIVDPKHPTAKFNRPKLAVEEYISTPELTLTEDESDDAPNMAPRGEYYTKFTLHKLTEDEESIRKF